MWYIIVKVIIDAETDIAKLNEFLVDEDPRTRKAAREKLEELNALKEASKNGSG